MAVAMAVAEAVDLHKFRLDSSSFFSQDKFLVCLAIANIFFIVIRNWRRLLVKQIKYIF